MKSRQASLVEKRGTPLGNWVVASSLCSLVKYDVSFWFGWQDQSDKKAKIQIIKSHQFRESPLSPNIPRISGVWFVIVFYVYDKCQIFGCVHLVSIRREMFRSGGLRSHQLSHLSFWV